MPGRLSDDGVIVDDQKEASTLQNRGSFGYPLKGGSLELDLIEACYLVEGSRMEVRKGRARLGSLELMRAGARSVNDFGTRYTVYRDIRQRGFVIKPDYGEFDFRVYPRGGTPKDSKTKYWVRAISEREVFDVGAYEALVASSERTRKELLLAVVDEEGDLTHYQIGMARPKGRLEYTLEGESEGHLFQDRVMVFDTDRIEALQASGHFGKIVGTALQLSLIEAVHLMDRGVLSIRNASTSKMLSPRGVAARAKSRQEGFELRLAAYADMRSKRLLVKTGFKYGTHFRVYEDDPSKDHARFLVHAVPEGHRMSWAEVSRAVRLAHGVKKDLLIAVVGDEVRYLRMRRVRP